MYFPTDPQTLTADTTELVTTLKTIESIMDNNTFSDILIQGDLNWDQSRNSGHSLLMKEFTERIGVRSVWERFPVSFTHIHTDVKSTSVLDHFLCNEGLLDFVTDAGVLHLGDNLSRHSPIMLKLSVGDIPSRVPGVSLPQPQRPAWYKATPDNIEEYTLVLNERLSNLSIPETIHCDNVHCSDPVHKLERDGHVLDLLTAMIESSHKTIPLTKPRKSLKGRKNIPGWKAHVEPFRQDAMFWHSVWLSSGKPREGELHRVMCWSRNKYHFAIRKLKRSKHHHQAQELLEASEKGDIELLAAMKEIKGTKAKGQTMPACVDGKTEPDDILEKFKDVYQTLYNSAETGDAVKKIKDRLKALIDQDSLSEVSKVTAAAVQEACSKMKSGKSDVSGAYTSDVLLHGPPVLFEHLAAVFRSFLVHGEVTEQLLCCAFLPLFKGGLKNPAKTDSYRAIAGSSQLLKLFDNVVLLLWGHLLTSDSLQFGYKGGTSTTQCSWLVSEVADYYIKRRSPVICVTLDCSKAFDKCRYDKLFQKLVDRSVPAIVVRALIHVYEEQTACVKLVDKRSVSFSITNGTRQGSVLSPALFAVYLDELLARLRSLGVGCHVGGLWYGAACFADDLVLLAPARTSAEMMLQCCEEYATEHNLQFSTDPNPGKSKSKCIFFTGKMRNQSYPDKLVLLGQELPWVEQANHLGHILHQSCTMDHDAVVSRARFISKTLDLRETFSFALPEQILRAVEVYASDCYGTMLYDLSSPACESYFKAWNTCVKLTWNVPRSTYTYIVEQVLAPNFVSLRNQVYSRYVNFFQQLFRSSSREVRHLVRIVARDVRSVTSRNVRLIADLTGLSPWDMARWRIKEKLPKSQIPANQEWRIQLIQKLLDRRRELYYQNESIEMIQDMLGSLCST